MPVETSSLVAGGVLSAVVCAVAFRLRALTFSGAVAAFVVGTIVFGIGGLVYSIPLLVFFGTSSGLSRLRNERKRAAMSLASKSHARDAWQVLANGGMPCLIVLASALLPPGAVPSSRDWCLLFLSAVATVNADTWATELGTLASATPRMITTLRPAPRGSSGAISLPGTLAGLVGAAVIVASALAVWPKQSPYLLWPPDAAESLAVVWAAFVGMLFDSLFGASVQAQYRCPSCSKVSEKPNHCGVAGTLRGGYRWITNDVVNAAASLAAVAAAWYLLRTFAWPTR